MKKLLALPVAALATTLVAFAELENVALHKPCTFEPREPFYSHCTAPASACSAN